MSELDHAAGAGIVGRDVTAVVRDGLGAHGAAGAAHGLDCGVALRGVEGGCAGGRGLHRMRFLGCEMVCVLDVFVGGVEEVRGVVFRVSRSRSSFVVVVVMGMRIGRQRRVRVVWYECMSRICMTRMRVW